MALGECDLRQGGDYAVFRAPTPALIISHLTPDLDELAHARQASKGIQPRAKQALHAMMYAEAKAVCEREMDKFVDEYSAKSPNAAASLVDNRDRLLTFFDFPAEHWKHPRTTNPIESTFATVKLRQRVTKGAGLSKERLPLDL
jgi:transposase-like protein